MHYIKKWFTHWGLVNSHGIKIGEKQCRELKTIRSEMRIKTPARRSIFITRDQVNAIVAEADRRELHHVSLSVLIRFEFLLRGVDVYGQWENAEDRQGGIRDGELLWVDGLTWDMIKPDLTRCDKVISKTRDSLPEPYSFDLTNTPDIRRRLYLHKSGAYVLNEGQGGCVVFQLPAPEILQGHSRLFDRMPIDSEPSDLNLLPDLCTPSRHYSDLCFIGLFFETEGLENRLEFNWSDTQGEPLLPTPP